MSANRRYCVPRLTADTGLGMTFSRGKILAGTPEVYFGPGQGPEVQDTYEPPTDWPAAGMLLRVPQVVWFSCFFPGVLDRAAGRTTILSGDDAHWQYHLAMDRTERFIGLFQESEIFLDGSTFDEFGRQIISEVFTSNITIPNLGYSELLRSRDAWLEAKETIEAIRPGRTYLADHWYYSEEDYADGAPSQNVSTGYSHLPGPPIPFFGVPRFGTNFLSIHYGHFAARADDTGIGPYWRVHNAGFANDPLIELDHEAVDSLARAVRASEMFAGYAIRLFGYEHDWAAIPPFNPGWVTSEPEADFLQKEATDSNALLAECAARLADSGVTYEGIAAPTAADYIALIADHFRFDPSTGADLPPE